MPQLMCEVMSCAHYNSGYCCKQEILVDGVKAKQKDQTSCESYYPMQDSFKASVECEHSDPQRDVEVQCQAEKCYYNHNLMCAADQIKIGGENADTRDETLCATFRVK